MTSNADQLPRFDERVLKLAADDPQLQELMPDASVERALRAPGLSYAQAITTLLGGYAGRPALGERAYEIVTDAATGRRGRSYLARFTTISYDELHTRIKGLANAWRHDGRHRVAPGDFVCILGFSGTDYVTVDLACAYARAVSVPLQTTLAGADLEGIFADTAPTAVAATVDDLVLAAELATRHESIRSIIAIDYDERADADREQFAAAAAVLAGDGSGAVLATLRELIAVGELIPWQDLPVDGPTDDDMAMLLHSSGSTGTPKGAIITERGARAQFKLSKPPIPIVRLCFAPLNHLAGRGMVYHAMARGGTAYFTAKADLSMLFEDMRLVRPTELMFFPRVLEMIHRHFQSEVLRLTRSGQDVEAVKAQVMTEMRTSFMGDRVSLMVVGSAPTTPEIRQFMLECFQTPLIDGYTSTEAGPVAVTINDRISRPPVIDYRLRDVPELGYYTTDKPYPRGELCVKTELSVPGYFKRPEATAKLFDADGYLLTGDIVEERSPDHVVYVDRRNDVLKLAQGEYVAVGALGTTFEDQSAAIQQIYVYGNSARSYLLAVVVPNMDVVASLIGDDPAGPELKALIRGQLKKAAEAAQLKSFEVPRDFIIEPEPFTHENGLLSSVHKRLRPALLGKYGARLEELYVELDRKQNDELMALQSGRSDLSVLDKVAKALEAVLGIHDLDLSQPYNFGQLGGDSLAATAFSALLHDIFGVELPVNAILSPTGNAQQWARVIEAELSGEHAARPTFETVHGAGAQRLNAADLNLARFLPPNSLVHLPVDPPVDASQTVLLTGATGYLGRFLCLEWLERLSATGGKLICLVRAGDVETATRRLAAAFDGPDAQLRSRFDALAGDHLEVVLGDVAEPQLGLDDATFHRLCADVDRIVHSGALVNHVLGYQDLFDPNVVGTANLIGLALTTRQKPIDFISSVAATMLVDRSVANNEDSPLRHSIALSRDYSFGYAASKWAAEHLLHDAHRTYGLPVNVFRGDMMLAHRGYPGQINVSDVFTRLLYSVVSTGLAPESFYQPRPDGTRANGHYDGLPVDFVAAAIVDSSVQPHESIRTFHVLNHHEDDGMSLDVFIDWIQEAGYAVERVPDYGHWLARFEDSLKALPEPQRQLSSLNVLDSLRRPYQADAPMPGSAHFQHAVRTLASGPEIPHLDHAFIDKCLDDMRRLELIPTPALIQSR